MTWLAGHIKGIMLVSGVATCTMVYAMLSPQAALRSSFGDTLEGPVANIVVRNWGGLITISGAMLIYGAFTPAVRRFAICSASAGKALFIALVLTSGRQFLGYQAGVAVVADTVMVLIFAAYLATGRDRG